MRGKGVAVAVAVGLCALGLAMAGPVRKAGPSKSTVARGEYLINAVAGCGHCHTPRTGATLDKSRWLAGGTEFKSPAGTNYSRNLTPDNATGLGKWTEKQFVGAMRKGLSPTRGELMPPMPLYDRITTQDLHAMWAYLRTVKPIHNEVPARKPAEQPKE
jgi:mono/diheme cytochrome c family protein